MLPPALDSKPNYPEAYYNLGTGLQQQGQLDEAVTCYHRALDLRPDYSEAHNNLGCALHQQGRLGQAVACYRTVVELRPDFPTAYSNLGVALQNQGRLDEAIVCHRKAVDLRPNSPEANYHLGNALAHQRRMDEARSSLIKAINLRPDYPEAHFYLARILLALGDMAAGWEEYEWRWQTPQMIKAHRNFIQPQWRGEAADGRTLLIHAEQGFGDTMQFCRYAPLAAARELRVIMEVQKPLVRLLSGLPGVELVIARGEELPPFDLHCPMLSMPLALGTTLMTIPGATPSLHADDGQVAAWRARLAAMANQGPRIGLVWAGYPAIHSPVQAARDRRRSLAPDRLAPLFDLPGVHFFSLQKGGPAAPEDFPLSDFMNEAEDFADTAALIANLDLVISVDTAIVHLTATLGKPVWMLDRFDPDWRWFTGRCDSPWYPTLRIYRQPRPGDWDPVLAEIARDLHSFAEGHTQRRADQKPVVPPVSDQVCDALAEGTCLLTTP
jgi:Flp pilus assembly protein TadD